MVLPADIQSTFTLKNYTGMALQQPIKQLIKGDKSSCNPDKRDTFGIMQTLYGNN